MWDLTTFSYLKIMKEEKLTRLFSLKELVLILFWYKYMFDEIILGFTNEKLCQEFVSEM